MYPRAMCSGLALLLMFSIAGRAQEVQKRDYTTPTKKLVLKDYPVFSDDYDFRDMEIAIQRQLKRFATKDLSGTILLGGKKYPLFKAPESLRAFQKLMRDFHECATHFERTKCYADFNSAVAAGFDVFAPDLKPGDPRYGEDKWAFFTGYDTQPIQASRTPTGEFQYPVYALPKSAVDRAKTRGQIDFHGALAGKGLELFYANNLFDLYLLHVEGGGYVTLDDNGLKKEFYISYDGTNGQKWNWISKYMIAQGWISSASTAAQRRFLRDHPQKREEAYSSCPSYVFFKPTSVPALGCDSVPLTDGRSLATDIKLYAFKGLLTFVEARRPEETGHYDPENENVNFIPFSRFFLDQDTGGAITGKARADLYFGKSAYALLAATYESEKGRIFFLMLK